MIPVPDARRRSGALETYVRDAWKTGPGPLLRIAGATFGLGIGLRHALYDAGVLRTRVPALPVVSVGGVTVGGSGKTPVTACVVAWLAEEGLSVGVATHGFADEMAVHRRLNSRTHVRGGKRRHDVVAALAQDGCDVVVVDDGFQRRRLGRDLDIVVLDAETAMDPGVRYLPAGPYRERLKELRRAAAIIVTRRVTDESVAREVSARLAGRFPTAAVGRCALRPGPLTGANDRAAAIASPAPSVGVAAVMKADVALAQMRDRLPSLTALHAFSDHAVFDRETADELIAEAGTAGMVGTLKDIVKLIEPVGEAVPLWYLTDELVWEAGEARVRERLAGVVVLARERSGSAHRGAS